MARVVAPDGRKWRVGRRWLTRVPRLRRRREEPDAGFMEGVGLDFDDAGVGLAIGVALLLVALVVLVVFPIVALAIELVLLVLLTLTGLVARFVLRHPWHVVASSGDREVVWEVRGWRASGDRVREAAHALRTGADLPR